MTRKKLEALVWKHTHRDFRSVVDGIRMRLHNVNGGSELWPLSAFSDEQLISKLPRAIRESL